MIGEIITLLLQSALFVLGVYTEKFIRSTLPHTQKASAPGK